MIISVRNSEISIEVGEDGGGVRRWNHFEEDEQVLRFCVWLVILRYNFK